LTSTGIDKARNSNQRISDNTIDITKQIIEDTKIFNSTSPEFALGGEPGSSEGSAAGNYLANSGDVRLGPMGNQLGIVEIIDDVIDVSIASQHYFPMLLLNGEGGAADNLSRIIPGFDIFLNQELIVQAGSFAITIQETVEGNILTPGTANVNLQPGDYAKLIFSIVAGNKWVVVWFSGNVGGGGVSFPIDFPEEDRGLVGSSTEIIDFTQSDRHAVIMELNGDIGISLTNTTADRLQISTIKLRQDGTGGHAFTGFTQTVANEQAIIDAVNVASGPGEFVVFIVRFLDGLFTAFLEDSNEITGGGGGGLNTNLSNMVSPTLPPVDLDMNQHNILGVTGIDLDGTTATIQGVVNLQFNQSGQSIIEKADPDGGLLYSVADLQAHIFQSGADEIARFEESAVNVFRLDMLGNSIEDIGFLESAAPNLPGAGFIRMGTTEAIRMRNPDNTDDLLLTSGADAFGNQALVSNIAGGVRLTISEFDMDVTGNDIVNTGDIIPAPGAPEVGLFDNAYNQMHSQFFVPVGAAIILERFGFSKNVNRLYVNYNDADADAGFGIFEQGIQHFGFSNPLSNIHEFFIGPNPFVSGEEYIIQLGENSNASGRISFIEGIGNDVLITRGGSGTDQGVQINSGVRFLSDRIRFLKNQDMNSLDITELGNIKSDGSATGTIGEIISADGGFNYFMRDTLAWEEDPAVKLTFRSTGITLETNGVTDNIDIFTIGANSNIGINAAADGILSLGIIAIDHLQFFAGFTEFSNANIFLSTGTQFISFEDAVAGGLVDTPGSGDINLFNDSNTGELSVKKSGGGVVSLEGGGFTSPLTTKGDLLGFDTINARIPVGTDGQVLTANSAVALGVEWAAAGGGSQTPILQDIDFDGFDIKDISNVEFRETTGSPGIGNNISANAQGMDIRALATDDRIAFFLGVNVELALEEDGELRWPQDGHKLVPQATAFQIISSSTTDRIELINGIGSTNSIMIVENFRTTWRTQTNDTQPYTLQLIQNNVTPSDGRTIVNIDMIAENSSSDEEIYARISASSQDITDTTEDGLLQLGVVSGGVLIAAIDIEGSSSGGANDALIGFFGVSPVVQQQLDSNPSNTEISTALRNLGLTRL